MYKKANKYAIVAKEKKKFPFCHFRKNPHFMVKEQTTTAGSTKNSIAD